MPLFNRMNGTKVPISPKAFETVVKAIRAEPGLTTFDYEAKTLVPVTTINHILECTAEGQRLVKAGKIAYEKRRGFAPAWTTVKGAKLNAPTVRAVMTLRLGDVQPLDSEKELADKDLRDEYVASVNRAEAAMLRPSQSPRRRAAHRDMMIAQANGQARREDATTTAFSALRQETEALKDYNRALKETLDLRAQLAGPKTTA